MANFHSLDLRKRVVEYVLAGNQVIIASNLFRVSRTTIYRWLDLVKTGNDLKPKQAVARSGYKINHELICTHFAEKPDATLQEVANVFSTHPSVIWYICKKQKITRKKRSHITKSVMNKEGKNS